MIKILLIWFLIVFIASFLYYMIKDISGYIKGRGSDLNTLYEDTPDEFEEITYQEKIESYDKQIDGYTTLIKLLDIAYKEETDTKKKAIILSKQLATLERLNKTIEKREKLD